MSRHNTEKRERRLDTFLMNVADNAEAAIQEYWQERETENRRYAMEYVTRRGLFPQQ